MGVCASMSGFTDACKIQHKTALRNLKLGSPGYLGALSTIMMSDLEDDVTFVLQRVGLVRTRMQIPERVRLSYGIEEHLPMQLKTDFQTPQVWLQMIEYVQRKVDSSEIRQISKEIFKPRYLRTGHSDRSETGAVGKPRLWSFQRHWLGWQLSGRQDSAADLARRVDFRPVWRVFFGRR